MLNEPVGKLWVLRKEGTMKISSDHILVNNTLISGFCLLYTSCELKTLLKQPILMLSSKSTTSEYLHQMFATHGLNLLPEVELNSNDLLMEDVYKRQMFSSSSIWRISSSVSFHTSGSPMYFSLLFGSHLDR